MPLPDCDQPHPIADQPHWSGHWARWVSHPLPLMRLPPFLLRSPALVVAAIVVLAESTAVAAQFDAICGKDRCRIQLTEQGFKGPTGFIPAERIVQWNAVGWDDHNALVASLGATGGALTGTVVGAAASCWTLIACPIGILAGAVVGGVAGSRAGKSADYRFSVEGYDPQGRKLVESFRFVNKKPVPSLVEKLTRISGLKMGKERNLALASPEPRVERGPRRSSGAPASPASQPPAASLNEQRGIDTPSRDVPGSLELDAPPPLLGQAIDPYQGTPIEP